LIANTTKPSMSFNHFSPTLFTPFTPKFETIASFATILAVELFYLSQTLFKVDSHQLSF